MIGRGLHSRSGKKITAEVELRRSAPMYSVEGQEPAASVQIAAPATAVWPGYFTRDAGEHDIEVCRCKSVGNCRTGDDGVWTPFDEWVCDSSCASVINADTKGEYLWQIS
jgi:hypothetical protein